MAISPVVGEAEQGKVQFNCDNACLGSDCDWCCFITETTNRDAVWFSMGVCMRARLSGRKLMATEQSKRQREGRLFSCRHINCFTVDVTVRRHNDPTPTRRHTETDSAAPPEIDTERRKTTPTVHVESARHVTVQAISVPIDLHVTQAQLHHVTDSAITQAVEDVIVAKINWDSSEVHKYRMKYRRSKQQGKDLKAWFEDQIHDMEAEIRVERLAGEKELEKAKEEEEKRLKSLTKQLLKTLSVSSKKRELCEKNPSELVTMLAEQQKESDQQVERLSQKLQTLKRVKEEQLAALQQCYEEEKQREQDKVMTFVLKLEERDEAVLRELAVGMSSESLRDVITRLFEDHHIRLMGVDCGLSFLMETPVSRWRSVMEKQMALQATLNQLLPHDVRLSASWSDVTEYTEGDVDIHLGKLVQVTVYPMTATPTSVFSIYPKTDDDDYDPEITSIVSIQDRTLVLADAWNSKVKVIHRFPSPSVTTSLTLLERPFCLAVLADGLVATTTHKNAIYFLRVSDRVTVQSRVETIREYCGITGGSSNTLIVSCERDSERPASVDVIDRGGRVLKTIINSESLTALDSPYYLCAVGSNNLLVSDVMTNTVYKVGLATGTLLHQITCPELDFPGQVCADKTGNVYIASGLGMCVLVRSPKGQWRRLLDAGEHSKKGYNLPRGVYVTHTGVLVVAWCRLGSGFSVTGHALN